MNQSGDNKNLKRRRNRGGGKGNPGEGKTIVDGPDSSASNDNNNTTPKGGPGVINSLLDETKTKVNTIYRDVLDHIGEGFHFKSRPSKGEIFSTPTVVL